MNGPNDLIFFLKYSPQANTLKEPFYIALPLAYVCSLPFCNGGFLMQMLYSFSSPVRATRSSLRVRPELNLIIIYVTDCGTFEVHPSSGLPDCSHLPVTSVQILF